MTIRKNAVNLGLYIFSIKSSSFKKVDGLMNQIYTWRTYNPVHLTTTLLFFGDNVRSRNAKNTHDTSFES